MCVFGPFVVFADFSVGSIVHSILNHVGYSLSLRFGVFWGNENKLAVDSSSVFNNLVFFIKRFSFKQLLTSRTGQIPLCHVF